MAKTNKGASDKPAPDTELAPPSEATSTEPSGESPDALRVIEERLLAIEERIFELPTHRELEDAIARVRDRRPAGELDRSDLPEVLHVRTRDGRKRHVCAGHTFGRAWSPVTTADLSDGQLKAIVRDDVLEVSDRPPKSQAETR